ncbi:hypothetical protein ACA910_019544 [Epithemia clementina (nom. ined.)]
MSEETTKADTIPPPPMPSGEAKFTQAVSSMMSIASTTTTTPGGDTTAATNTKPPKRERMITLVSKDEAKFLISKTAAEWSEFVRDAINDIDSDDDDDDDDTATATTVSTTMKEVHCLNVMGPCLEKVVEFLLHHHQTERFRTIILPLRELTFDENMKQTLYRDFINQMDIDMVYQVLAAANYMNIRPLLELTCLRVTFELSDKSAEEIQELLDLPTNLTPEEQAKEYESYAWIFDESNHERAAKEEEGKQQTDLYARLNASSD